MLRLVSTRSVRLLATALAVFALLSLAPGNGSPARAAVRAAVPSFGTLPVFRIRPPNAVNEDTTRRIESLLPGLTSLGSTTAVSDTTFVGGSSLRQLLITNPTSITRGGGQAVHLEQYSASGGFFAENTNAAFPTGPVSRGPFDATSARIQACQVLHFVGLFSAYHNQEACDSPSIQNYNVTIQRLAGVNPNGTGASAQETAAIVNVPLSVALPSSPTVSPPRVPLGGPGGHLSLVLTSLPNFKPRTQAVTDTFSLLPDNVPGVAAIAAPMYQRTTEITPAATLPQLDINKIIAGLGATYTNFQPGTPQLIYYVEHPAVPQKLLLPMYTFPDATALIGGEQVDLKGINLPAVDLSSMAPQVVITTPTNGFSYGPGSNTVSVRGTVTGGTGPYQFSLELGDGTVLAAGNTAGAVSAPNVALPIDTRFGGPVNQVLRLVATDANGFTSSALIALRANVNNLWLPLVANGSGTTSAANTAAIAPAQSGYRVGVEWVQYYHGTNPDLSGTSPDANGFYNTMRANRRSDDQGFAAGFKWSNDLAWEKDWKDCSLGGIDCGVVDNVDFAYFSGHGSPARIYFGVSKDSTSFFGGNARYSNLRWAAFSSCQTIRGGPYVSTSPANPPLANWFNAFQGLNELLGFHSNMGDIAFGAPVADRMRVPNFFPLNLFPASALKALQPTIAQAWVDTAFQMNAGKPSYLFVIGTNGRNTSTDKLPLSGEAPPSRPGPISTYNWVWWDE